jgi:homopolymeric O-antigen transport system ATP-binding protein
LLTSFKEAGIHMNAAGTHAAVAIENLGKRYSLGHKRAEGDGMRHALEQAVRDPLAWVKSDSRRKQKPEDFWALRGVSLQIQPGEVVGIIGRNGAGKSTLLKLLSRITVPTEGRIRINGRIASLLEVGTGFHQELTGRENIFLNGAILGMSRNEIIRKFDEIVAFAEVEEFLDTPVKRYSSGMYVRLAFAVAAHLEPEILIVDEVLAVGDSAFQKKCLDKMGSFANSGRTVLFVSHNMEAVRNLCQRGIWMKDGSVHKDSAVEETLAAYFDEMSGDRRFFYESPHYGLTIHNVVLKNGRGQKSSEFHPGSDLIVEIEYEARRRLERPYLVVSIHGRNGTCFTANMLLDGNRPKELSGIGRVACRFKALPLLPQSFSIRISLRTNNGRDMIVNNQEVAYFQVVGDLRDYGYKGEFLSKVSDSTPVVIPYEWYLPDGSIAPVSLAPCQGENSGIFAQSW